MMSEILDGLKYVLINFGDYMCSAVFAVVICNIKNYIKRQKSKRKTFNQTYIIPETKIYPIFKEIRKSGIIDSVEKINKEIQRISEPYRQLQKILEPHFKEIQRISEPYRQLQKILEPHFKVIQRINNEIANKIRIPSM